MMFAMQFWSGLITRPDTARTRTSRPDNSATDKKFPTFPTCGFQPKTAKNVQVLRRDLW